VEEEGTVGNPTKSLLTYVAHLSAEAIENAEGEGRFKYGEIEGFEVKRLIPPDSAPQTNLNSLVRLNLLFRGDRRVFMDISSTALEGFYNPGKRQYDVRTIGEFVGSMITRSRHPEVEFPESFGVMNR
jgi:hypothetical protein